MTLLQFSNTFLVSTSWLIGGLMIYKCLKPKKYTPLGLLIFYIVLFIEHYLFYSSDILSPLIPNRLTKQQIFVFIVILTFVIFTEIGYYSKRTEKYTVLGIYLVISIIPDICNNTLMYIFGYSPKDYLHPTLKFRLLIDITYFIINLILCLIVAKYYNRFTVNVPWKVSVAIFFVISSCTYLYMLSINPYSPNNIKQFYAHNAITSLICIFILISSMILINKSMSNQQRLKEKYNWIKKIQTLNVSHSKDIQKKATELKQIQHDFKDNLAILKLLINSDEDGNIEKANALIDDLNKDIENSKISFYTQNLTLNAVISYEIEKAKEKDIEVSSFINMPDDLGKITDSDLSILIINLLNNAIEACQKLDFKDRNIELKIAKRANLLIIKTINPYANLICDKKGRPVTTKDDKENHGIGLSIVKNIAEKYEGFSEISNDEKTFVHTVSLNLNT